MRRSFAHSPSRGGVERRPSERKCREKSRRRFDGMTNRFGRDNFTSLEPPSFRISSNVGCPVSGPTSAHHRRVPLRTLSSVLPPDAVSCPIEKMRAAAVAGSSCLIRTESRSNGMGQATRSDFTRARVAQDHEQPASLPGVMPEPSSGYGPTGTAIRLQPWSMSKWPGMRGGCVQDALVWPCLML